MQIYYLLTLHVHHGLKGPQAGGAVTISQDAKLSYQRDLEKLKSASECSELEEAYTPLPFTICWPVTWLYSTSKGSGHNTTMLLEGGNWKFDGQH